MVSHINDLAELVDAAGRATGSYMATIEFGNGYFLQIIHPEPGVDSFAVRPLAAKSTGELGVPDGFRQTETPMSNGDVCRLMEALAACPQHAYADVALRGMLPAGKIYKAEAVRWVCPHRETRPDAGNRQLALNA